jgi:PAS domain S-box-containing protein
MTAAEVLIQTALLGEAVDSGPALVFVADEEMRYIAVNEFAAEALGYTRDELLELRVSEVARERVSPDQYDELLLHGFHHGTSILTCKDGTPVELHYRATKTRVAGLDLFVSVGFLAEAGRSG